MTRKLCFEVLLGVLLCTVVSSAEEASSGEAEYTIEGEFICYGLCSSSVSAGFRLIATLISTKDVRERFQGNIPAEPCDPCCPSFLNLQPEFLGKRTRAPSEVPLVVLSGEDPLEAHMK